jgi:uncharacterized protein with PIN domain
MTSAATIRFYAELNDFLAPDQRQRDLSCPFVIAPSVKDAIEGLGVPHTEVDLILVNGESVDFAHRLADGDRISVYPVFERLDISGQTKLRPDPLRAIQFVADGHLGTLCRYLRLVGFDTSFDPRWSDSVLADVSVAEHRILLTRDRGLLKRRAVTHGLFVRGEDPQEQLLDVVRRLHLGEQLRPFTRCMVCNGLLDDVDKALIGDQLEAGTRRAFDAFQRCRDCGLVYWQGSHYPRLLDLVARARAVGIDGSHRSGVRF